MEDSALKTKNQLARISAKINQLKKKYPTFEETYNFSDGKISNSVSMELKTRKSSMDLKSHKQSTQQQSRQGSCSKSFYKDELNDLKKQIISSMQIKDIQSKGSNGYHNNVSNTRMKHISNPSIHLYELDKSNNFIAVNQKTKIKQEQKLEQQKQFKKLQQEVDELTSFTQKLQKSFQILQKQTVTFNQVQSMIAKHINNQKLNFQITNLNKNIQCLEQKINQEKSQRENITQYLMTEIKELKDNLQKNSVQLQDQEQRFRSQLDSISFSSLPMQFPCSQQSFQELQTKFKKEIFDLRNEIELIYHKIDQQEYRNKALKNLSLNSNRSSNKENSGPSSTTSRDQKIHKFQQKIQNELRNLTQKFNILQEKLIAEEQIQSKSYQIFEEYNKKVTSIQESLRNLQCVNKSMQNSHHDLQKQHNSTKAHLNQLQVKFTSFNIILTDLQNNTETQMQQNKNAIIQELTKIRREFEVNLKVIDQKSQNFCRFIQGLSREAISKCDFIWTDFQNFKAFAFEKWREISQSCVRINECNAQQKIDLLKSSKQSNDCSDGRTQKVNENAKEKEKEELEEHIDNLRIKQDNNNQLSLKQDKNSNVNKAQQYLSTKSSFLQQLTRNSLVLAFALKD